MLTERYLKIFWLILTCVTLGLILLVLAEYRAFKAQAAQLSSVQAQYKILNQKLADTVVEQAAKIKQLELAEKKSSYALN